MYICDMINTVELINPSIPSSPSFRCVCGCVSVCVCAHACVLRMTQIYSLRFIFIKDIGL